MVVQQNQQRGKEQLLDKSQVDPALASATVGGEEGEEERALPKENMFQRSSSLLPETDVSLCTYSSISLQS